MPIPQIIISVCWSIFLLYWLISSFSLKPTKETTWGSSRFRMIVLLGAFALFVLNRFVAVPFFHLSGCQIDWRGCHYGFGPFSSGPVIVQWISVIFVLVGLAIAIAARRKLASNWSSNIDVKKNHELMTTGIYGYVRHPIYTGVLLMLFGTVLFFQTFGILLIFFAMLVFFKYKSIKEEELMTKHFPKEYPAYKKRVKSLIPYLW